MRCGGKPRRNRRGGCHHRYIKGYDTPEEIATSYDISIAEVHTALAYAFSHPEEMRDIEARNQSLYEEHASNRIVSDETSCGPAINLLADGNIETEWQQTLRDDGHNSVRVVDSEALGVGATDSDVLAVGTPRGPCVSGGRLIRF